MFIIYFYNYFSQHFRRTLPKSKIKIETTINQQGTTKNKYYTYIRVLKTQRRAPLNVWNQSSAQPSDTDYRTIVIRSYGESRIGGKIYADDHHTYAKSSHQTTRTHDPHICYTICTMLYYILGSARKKNIHMLNFVTR